jgi:hypothetical protein
MKRYKIISSLLFVLLSGCAGTATQFPHSPSLETPEASPPLFQTEVQANVESTEKVGVKPTPDLTQEILSVISEEQLQRQFSSLLPDFVGGLDEMANLTFYEIEVNVELDPSHVQASIEGMAHITYTHTVDTPLDELVLMLWPNDTQYNADMVVGPIKIDGRLVDFEEESGGVVLRVPLIDQIQVGESINMSIPFRIESSGSIRDQRRRFGITHGVLMAPTFYPLIPRLIDGEWQDEIPPEGGDTTNSDIALYQVTITASEEMDLIASGVEVDRKLLRDHRQSVVFVTGPMRDFAFAVGSLEKITDVVNDVTLNAWVLPGHNSSGKRLLNAALKQMGFLHDLVGPYPYTELDILDTPCAFGGIEYPGLIYICSVDDGYFVDTVVHEVAHQWFYGLIGNDQIHEPWLDEAAATYWQVLYYENIVGDERASSQLDQYRYWVSTSQLQDTPIGLGIGDYESSGDYYTTVYYKGALFYHALRNELGDESFFEFLETYYERYRYQFVNTEAFHATAEEVCQCDLDDFFDLWVYQGGEISGW